MWTPRTFRSTPTSVAMRSILSVRIAAQIVKRLKVGSDSGLAMAVLPHSGEHRAGEISCPRIDPADQELPLPFGRDQVGVHELPHVVRDRRCADPERPERAHDVREVAATADVEPSFLVLQDLRVDPQPIRIRERPEYPRQTPSISHASTIIEVSSQVKALSVAERWRRPELIEPDAAVTGSIDAPAGGPAQQARDHGSRAPGTEAGATEKSGGGARCATAFAHAMVRTWPSTSSSTTAPCSTAPAVTASQPRSQ